MITIDLSNNRVSDAELANYTDWLALERQAMAAAIQAGGYDTDYASLNLLDDRTMVETIKATARPFMDADTILLAGMGGPGMNAKAVFEAIRGKYHNDLVRNRSSSTSEDPSGNFQGVPVAPVVLFADTVDGTRISALTEILQKHLEEKKKVVVIASTQSGGTAETIANMEHFIELFEKSDIDPTSAMPVVTNEDTKLHDFAKANGFAHVTVPPKVGGRYSVFSAVGLFPLHLMGIDIDALLAGARAVRNMATGELNRNPVAQSAASIAHHYEQGKNIYVQFLLSPEFESVGLWCRQNMAESLGKATDHDGQQVNVGMTPTVVIGSRDLHSMFQLYMEGPDDKFTSFIRVGTMENVTVPSKPEFDKLVDHLQGKTYSEITQAIGEGVLHAYQQTMRPYVIIDIPDASAQSLGALLQWKMMQTMYLGRLMNVNPFDQPGVELYKVETKRILAEQ